MMDSVKILAPAKINLFLNILNRRMDGYHFIRSGITFINLFDELKIKKSNKMQINYKGPFKPKKKKYEDCVILKTLNFLNLNLNFDITITKNIPVRGGLGSASTNAAALIRALYEINLIDKIKIEDYASIGADIPCFLFNKNCLVTGMGEIINYAIFPKYYFLLVKPKFSNSTKDMYDCLYREVSDENLDYKKNEISEFDNGNDFEKIAIHKNNEISNIIDFLDDLEYSIFARMTGSGSCCYAVFEKEKYALKANEFFKSSFPDMWTFVGENNY
jgi:4-diphosphocytidyl-2-C-methyl-D-erythritol kinase